ncbi:MAG: hypothetical protein KC931_15555, partial [Candidatus Omnitrophica bacterium]|nr:hypothetical protein [Candidatus Omnitrophota bacterium]
MILDRHHPIANLLWSISLFLIAYRCDAQWMEQTIELKSGWNSVYLEVEPFPAECSIQLLGLPVESVATYDPNSSPVEFIEDPSNLVPELPDWRFYFPKNDPRSFATNLYVFQAATPYLIKCSAPATWKVVGRPLHIPQNWKPNSYNLVGFPVDPDNPPTVESWFAPSTAHSPIDFWRLDSAGVWQKVNAVSTTTIEPGVAYWVYSNGESDYQGPLDIALPQGTELNYERGLVEQAIEVSNVSALSRSVTVRALNSTSPPDPTLPIKGGEVPLTYYGRKDSGQNTQFGFFDLPETVQIEPGELTPHLFQLAVDRTRMKDAPASAVFQSILEIKDDHGYRKRIGVLSRGRARDVEENAAKGVEGTADPATGLWVGSVSLNLVNDANLIPTTYTPTASPFEFRVMMHVGADGSVRLLNEAIQLWRDGTTKPDPNNPEIQIVDTPGRSVLLTPPVPPSLMGQVGTVLKPGTLRDGRPFARRISTAAYSLHDENGQPIAPEMTREGNFGEDGGKVQILLTIHDNDPVNPFHHQFHPQHRYLEPGEPGPDWTILWNMTFQFTSDPQDGLPAVGFGDTLVGG